MGFLGSIGKAISGAVKGVGKAVGGVAKIAAPFLPGPFGAVAGLVGSMTDQGQAQGQANAYTQQGAQMPKAMADAFNTYYQPLIQAQMQSAGYNPTTKTFDPNYNPYQMGTGGTGDAIYNKFAEQNDAAYDQAINQLGADAVGRGVVGANNITSGQMADLRGQQGQDLAGFRRDLMVKGEDERQQRLANLLPMMTNMGFGAGNSLMGLGGMYQSQADNMGQGLSDLAGTMASSGTLGNVTKTIGNVGSKIGSWLGQQTGLKRKQSTSPGTTTANAAPKVVTGKQG
jgi:hypothetical protein